MTASRKEQIEELRQKVAEKNQRIAELREKIAKNRHEEWFRQVMEWIADPNSTAETVPSPPKPLEPWVPMTDEMRAAERAAALYELLKEL